MRRRAPNQSLKRSNMMRSYSRPDFDLVDFKDGRNYDEAQLESGSGPRGQSRMVRLGIVRTAFCLTTGNPDVKAPVVTFFFADHPDGTLLSDVCLRTDCAR